jgi:hypothetical protein
MLALVLDGAIAVLILVGLGLGLRLQRDLRLLRSSDGELERLIAALDSASQRSEAALHGLKQAAATADERLACAQRLLDDLHFLTNRGEQLADRLEEQIRKARPGTQRSEPPVRAVTAKPAPFPADHAGPTSDLERTLSTLR